MLPTRGAFGPGFGPAGAAGAAGVALAAGATGAAGAGACGRGAGVGLGEDTSGAAGASAAGAAGAAGAAVAAGAAGAAGAGRGPGRGPEDGRGVAEPAGLAAVSADVPFFGAAGVLVPKDSRRRRATGASTVDDADFTNSPCSLSVASSSLLVTPSSLANSCTRALPATALLTERSSATFPVSGGPHDLGLSPMDVHRWCFTVCS